MEEKEQGDQTLHFEPSAYLQRLLGRELISNEYIAVAELVKNGYDAGATEVVIELSRDVPQSLVISDNGTGMSLEEFNRLWMVPGYSEKTEHGKAAGRPLLGEKGIGRFAADKLARVLRVVTKKAGDEDALCVTFDWADFEDRTVMMRDVDIPYTRLSDPDLGRYRSGTRLELEELRKQWDRKDWQNLQKELGGLVTPFRTVRRFRIVADAEGWRSGEVSSPFATQAGYTYAFSLSKGGRITRRISRPRRSVQKLGRPAEETSRRMYGTTSFGPVRATFYYVDSARSLKRAGFEPGVAIYRDGFRVEPYGREDDDWLKIKTRKASRHGHAPITPSRLFGFVEITRDENPDLKDVTNREGLLDTPEFMDFLKFVRDEFQRLATVVERDKEELDTTSKSYEAQQAQAMRQTRAQAFAEMAVQLAHQLRQPLNHIRGSSTNLRDWLEQRGPLDQFVRQSTDRIERNVMRMNESITNLSKVARGLGDRVVELDLGAFVKEEISKHRDDFEQSGVTLQLVNCEDGHTVKFSRMTLGMILDNFLTNALRAAAKADRLPGSVTVKIEQLAESKYRLEVTDNGKGVAAEHRDKLFEKFIRSEYGFGMGLVWSRICAVQHGGHVGYVDAEPSGATFFVLLEQKE